MANSQPSNKDQQNTYKDKPRDYVRQQKGHSILLHLCLCMVLVGMFTIPYYTLSPNHYWHA